MSKEMKIVKKIEDGEMRLAYLTWKYAGTLVKALTERGLHICSAESCTAGLVAAAVASIPGASEVLDKSFVTYSEQAKADLVGVSMDTIREYGVVSPQVARQMADGAFGQAGAGVGIGITGYADPSSIQAGRVCIGVRAACKQPAAGNDSMEKDLYCGVDYRFTGSRDVVRKKAAAAALALAVIAVLDEDPLTD